MLLIAIMCMFFFKQKTAYEMRISDWSSDVCSSDLANPNNPTGTFSTRDEIARLHGSLPQDVLFVLDQAYAEYLEPDEDDLGLELAKSAPNVLVTRTFSKIYRSEEHTSELQSLMRISYAVFCLKKKTK